MGTFLRTVEAVDFALTGSQVNKIVFYYEKAHLQQYFSNTVCSIRMSISHLCLNFHTVEILLLCVPKVFNVQIVKCLTCHIYV